MKKEIDFKIKHNFIFVTLPFNEEIDLDEVRNIEKSLREYTSGERQEGITYGEACKFLDWITLNTRKGVINNITEDMTTASFSIKCAPSQRINTTILQKIGLDARPVNMANCVGDLPKTEDDIRRIKNGWNNNNLRHAVVTTKFPIQENGKVVMHKILLDPTFRQFCLEEDCKESVYWDEEKNFEGKIAPRPGYFLTEDYLKREGTSGEGIERANHVAQALISRGYIELTEENAKVYGDAFARAGIRYQFRDVKLTMSGKDYINQFENEKNIDRISSLSKDEEEFTKTPLEIKDSIFEKIKKFFQAVKQRKGPKYLPKPSNDGIPTNNRRSEFLERTDYPEYEYPDLSEIEKWQDERSKGMKIEK